MYNELVHLLDLCILSYQLHNQTLIWPMDPYYEQMLSVGLRTLRRRDFMTRVHGQFDNGIFDPNPAPPGPVHGPSGYFNGLDSNTNLDPILSDYSQIDPQRPSVVRPNREKDGWILYKTPAEITGRIKDVRIAHYEKRGGYDAGRNYTGTVLLSTLVRVLGDVVIVPVVGGAAGAPVGGTVDGTDLLYCFEGGTGRIRRTDTTPVWGITGFVLARQDENDPLIYDVYIVFRGSRSGETRIFTPLTQETGNPDWVTDMDFGAGSGVVQTDREISTVGAVSPGFAESAKSMLPTIMQCLEDIQNRKANPVAPLVGPAQPVRAPRTIYVTGHSLGAALAVHFTSAVLLGHSFNNRRPIVGGIPNVPGRITDMPGTIRHWPWSAIQLVPFALPVVGGKDFHNAFNITLASRTFYLPLDVVPQRRRMYPVGKEYEIPIPTLKHSVPNRHEPRNIRRYLIDELQRRNLFNSVEEANTLSNQKPWKVCTTFNEVLDEGGLGDQVTEIFGGHFKTRLRQYLDVLIAEVPQDRQARLRGLQAFVANPNPGQCQTEYSNCRDVFAYKDDHFDKFLRLSIFLSTVQGMTYRRAKELAGDAQFGDHRLQ